MNFIAMSINWPVIVIVGLALLALVVFMIRRNLKDEKKVEQTINQMEEKPVEHKPDNESKT